MTCIQNRKVPTVVPYQALITGRTSIVRPYRLLAEEINTLRGGAILPSQATAARTDITILTYIINVLNFRATYGPEQSCSRVLSIA